jgi:hypothetical protein
VETRWRVWLVRYEQWQPDSWNAVPADATAIEPAERGTMSARRARRYVEAFNRAAHGGPRKIWAVAVPITVRYVGDPLPGEPLAEYLGQRVATSRQLELPTAHKKSPLLACQESASNGLPPRESPDASCGVPVRTPATRQSHQTP